MMPKKNIQSELSENSTDDCTASTCNETLNLDFSVSVSDPCQCQYFPAEVSLAVAVMRGDLMLTDNTKIHSVKNILKGNNI